MIKDDSIDGHHKEWVAIDEVMHYLITWLNAIINIRNTYKSLGY